MDEDSGTQTVGQQLRTVRKRRRLTQQVVADLAGISRPYLSMIESGQRPVEKRATLESLARALRMSPLDFGVVPTAGGTTDPEMQESLAGLPALEYALTDLPLFEATVTPRPRDAVLADAERLITVLRPAGDSRPQVRLIPGLLRELNALAAVDRSRPVLAAMAETYHAAQSVAKYLLGARVLPGVAVLHLRAVARELGEPRYLGLAQFARAQVVASGDRALAREMALVAADALQVHVGVDDGARQVYGLNHLTAALASATLGDSDGVSAHLDEARDVAELAPGDDAPDFANLFFNRTNVAFWETTIALEMGEPGRVLRDLHPHISPERVVSKIRQSSYWTDLSRSYASNRKTRDAAVAAMMRAEKLAPSATRTNVWAKETLADIYHKTSPDKRGADLRGLAYRMQVA